MACCRHYKGGFTLIEVLVGTFLVLIVFLGIFGGYQLALKVVSQSKARIIATAIANQNIEMIRNLPYKKVGTTPHAIDEPAGDVSKITTTSQNNIEYTVETKIIYINDCFDGPQSISCPIAPVIDDCVKDYKRAEVKVSWGGSIKGELALTTDVMPKNLNQEQEECTGAAAGVLSVSVFNALGEAVFLPLIAVIDPNTGETLTSYQPPNGKHDFVLTPNSYKIKITKTGYSDTQSYGAGDNYNEKIIAEPAKSHPVVYEGKLTEVGFSIDVLGLMIVQTRGTKEQGYPLIHNVTFKMEGVKTVGNDAEGNPIYKYSQNHTTNGAAEIDISDLEWDSYSFYVDSPDYKLLGIESPLGTETSQPIDLLPGSVQAIGLILKAENTLLVKVQDALSKDPIFAASVRLSNLDLGYDGIQPTDEEGKTLFIPLKEATYDLEVQIEGYQTYTGTVLVSGDVTKIVDLEKVE